jgi:hypothetical protein
MTSEALKEVYKTPRVQIRGVFLCEEFAASQCPTINGGVTYLDYDTTYSDLQNQSGDIIVF